MAHDGDDQGNPADSDAVSPRTPPARRMSSMPGARTQNLRVLEGRFVLERVSDVRKVAPESGLLALALVPAGRLEEAVGVLRRAGHQVAV